MTTDEHKLPKAGMIPGWLADLPERRLPVPVMLVLGGLSAVLFALLPPLLFWALLVGAGLSGAVLMLPGVGRTLSAYRRVLVIPGVALVASAAVTLRRGHPLDPGGAEWMLLGGALLIGLSVWRDRDALPSIYAVTDRYEDTPSARRTVRRWSLAGGVILLLALLQTHVQGVTWSLHVGVQLALLAGGIGLIARGMLGRPDERTDKAVPDSAGFALARWEWALLAVIVVAALIPRAVDLEYLFFRPIDEMHSMNALVSLWDDPTVPILSPHGEVTAFTWLYPLAQTVTAGVYGSTLTSLRALSVIVGVLGVVALWWLARELFDRKTALLAAALLASFPVHVHFSRIGINNILDPLLACVLLAFLARGMKHGRRGDFVAAGVVLGLTQYFYEGGRLLYPPLALAFVGGWLGLRWLERRTRGIEPVALNGGAGVFGVTALLVGAPVWLALLFRGMPLLPRFGRESAIGEDWTTRFDQLRETLLYYATMPNMDWFYGPGYLLVGAVLPLFLLGIVFVLWRWRTPGMLLIVLWLVGAAAGNSLLFDRLWSARWVVVLPAVALTLALGGHYILRRLVGRGRLLNVALIAGAVAVGVVQHSYYFGEHIPRYNEPAPPPNDITFGFDDVLVRMVNLPADTNVHVVHQGTFWMYDVETYKSFHGRDDLTFTGWQPENFDPLSLERVPFRERHAYFFMPGVLHLAGANADLTYSPLDTTPAANQYGLLYFPAQDDAPWEPDYTPVNTGVAWHLLALFALAGVLVRPGARLWRRADALGGRFDARVDALLDRAGARMKSRLVGWQERLTAPLIARPWTAPVLVLVAIVPLMALAVSIRAGAIPGMAVQVTFLGVMVVALGLALDVVRRRGDETGEMLAPAGELEGGPRWRWLTLAAVAVGLLTLANVSSGWLSVTVQFALLVAGAALIVTAFMPAGALKRGRAALVAWRPSREAGLLVVILLLALVARLVHLESAVFRFVDEIHPANAVSILRENPNTALLEPYSGVPAFPQIYAYLQLAATQPFGATLTALRIVSVILGTLTVAGVYFLARTLFNRETALLAALALATFPPHVHFSRIGINNIADPLFGVLALLFAARGVRGVLAGRGRALDFALAGVMLGLTQYFYEGGRLLFPVVVGGYLLLAGGRRLGGGAWSAFGTAAALISLPVYVTWLLGGHPLLPRLSLEIAGGAFWDRLLAGGPLGMPVMYGLAMLEPLAFLFTAPDQSWFYAGDTALLLVPVVPVALLGIGFALWGVLRGGAGRDAGILLLLWLLAAVMGNAALAARMESPRYVVIFPLLAILVAVGAAKTLSLLAYARNVRWGVLAACGIALAGLQMTYYFGTHLPAFAAAAPENTYLDDARLRASNLPDNTHVHIITNQVTFDFDTETVMRYRGRANDGVFVTTMRPVDLRVSYLRGFVPQRNYAFFVRPDDRESVITLMSYFDLDGPITSAYAESPEDGYYVMYYIWRGWAEPEW